VVFDQSTNEIGLYFRDMECAQCGTLATAPIPDNAEEDYDASI